MSKIDFKSIGLTEAQAHDYIDGFFAWDGGCVDSGIKDSVMRKHLLDLLMESDGNEVMMFLTDHAKNYIEGQYTLEDVRAFTAWVQNNGLWDWSE